MNNKPRGLFGERPPPTFEVDPKVWRRRTRRDVVLFGTGTVAALASARSFLPNVNRMTTRWPKRSTLHVARYRLTPNRRLLRSKITTTELLPILGIFPDG